MVIALLIFVYWFSFQVIFYPILLGAALTKLTINPRSNKSGLVFLLISILFFCIVTASMLIRRASLDLIVDSNRFYLGILFVSSVMLFNRKLKLTTWHLIMLAVMSIYEVLSLNVLRLNPIFYQFSSSWSASDLLTRSAIGGGFYRALGPALNSSVSGSIYAIFFLYFLKSRNFNLKGFEDYVACITLALAFLACASATAVISFVILAACLFIPKYAKRKTFKIKKKIIFSAIIFSFLAFFLAQHFYDFFRYFQKAKLSSEYLEFIFEFKKQQLQVAVPDYVSLLFGSDLSRLDKIAIFGDFLFLDAVVVIGCVPLILVFWLMYLTCPKKNRVFLIAAIISSMHYGTLFSLTGQIVFAALVTNQTNLERGLLLKKPLKSSKLQM